MADRPGFPDTAPGLISSVIATARDVRGLVADHLELATLEAQRAAGGLVRVLVVTIVAAILLVAAWVVSVIGVASWATDAGLSLTATLFIAAAANIVVAGAMLFWLYRQVPDILFAATLRQLRRTLRSDDNEEALE